MAPIACSESPEKVLAAVGSIFPGMRLEVATDVVRGEADSLSVLEMVRLQIRSRRIRVSARAMLMRGVSDGFLKFYVNKQAAYVGRLSFWDPAEEHSPSPIMVKVTVEDPLEVVEWLTR